MRAFLFVVGMTIACLGGPAGAAEPSARELYERGTQAYRESRHDEAVALFRKAFEIEPHAELAYDLGRAQEAAGHLRSAVQSFREYLRLAPDAKDRTVVERRIENLERRFDAPGPPPNPSAAGPARPAITGPIVPIEPRRSTPATPAADERSTLSLPTWIALGVGAGALGTALGFELARRSAVGDVERAETQLEHRDRYQAAEKDRDLARAFAGVGAAAALTGGLLFYFDLSARPRDRAGRPSRSGFRARAGADRGAFCLVGHFRF